MVNFFHEIKVYERPIKLTKNMLSPYKNKCRTTAKRKTPEEGHNNTSEKKKEKRKHKQSNRKILLNHHRLKTKT